MNHSLQHSQALAAATHNRLVEGGDVVLTGFGLLRRVHEPARVTTREDGQKELLPPQNVIRFLPDASLLTQSDDALVRALSDALPEDAREPREILDDTVSRLRESFAVDKELVLENVGRFSDEDGLTVFEPADALIGVVNKPFAGLPPIAPRTKHTPGDSATEAVTDLVEEAVPEEEIGAGVSSEHDTAEMPSSDAMEEPESDLATQEDSAESPEEPPSVREATILDVLAGQSAEDTEDTEEITAETPASQLSEKNEPEAVPPPLPTANNETEITPTDEAFEEAVVLSETTEPDTQDLADPAAIETKVQESEASAKTPEEAEIDDDIDAVLASVWTPVAAASSDEMLESTSRMSELEEDASVSGESETEEDDAALPLIATGAGAAAADTMVAPPPVRPPRLERERRSRIGLVLVPAVLALCVLTIFAVWPRFNNRSPVDSQATENGSTAPSRDASAEIYATHAGGTTDSEMADDADLSTIDSPQMQLEEEAPTRELGAEPVIEQPQPELTPTPRPPAVAVAPPPLAARPEPVQPQTGGQLPRQLRGPGEVNPAEGGATWILASGNRTSAEELAARYRRQGYRSSVLAGEANGLTVYRVAVGQFANSAEARGLRSRLPSDAPDGTWVLNF